MINWMFYPRNSKAPEHILEIVKGFEAVSESVDSEKLAKKDQPSSNEVLEKMEPYLTSLGYEVEKSKAAEDKIRIPVYYGSNGSETVAYEVDAYLDTKKTVIEVEAGQATINYKFLKDFYEACLMDDIDYLCIAVCNEYKYGTNQHSFDFKKVTEFFDAMYMSNRVSIPLKGILIVGY